tara:strand:- start:8741 stop:9388 length:648 start_codon:yes stop_codon:yes gene_type:complete
MYQLNPASIESTKEPLVEKKIKQPTNNNNNKTIKNKKQVNFYSSDQENLENKKKLTNINTLLSKLHDDDEDDDDDELSGLNISEKMTPMTNEHTNKDLINSELKKMNSNSENNNTILESAVNSNYSNFQDSYKKNLEYLNNINEKQSFTNYSQSQSLNYDNKQLISKLDYIIHLLEEQHNEKTNHITEELILYLFLGIFIIFVLDSFAKASKYIR